MPKSIVHHKQLLLRDWENHKPCKGEQALSHAQSLHFCACLQSRPCQGQTRWLRQIKLCIQEPPPPPHTHTQPRTNNQNRGRNAESRAQRDGL